MIVPVNRWQLAPWLSLCLIAGIWADWRLFHAPAEGASEYHAKIHAAADHVPYRVGQWVGEDVSALAAAVAMLRPNVLLSRRFENQSTGEQVTLIIVQCRDARDMAGHYPPICYPSHGWTAKEAVRRDITVDSRTVPGMVYRFTSESVERFDEIMVYSFFVLHDGSFHSGHSGALKVAADRRVKAFGAAQFQVVFDASMTEDRGGEVCAALLLGVLPMLDAISSGDVR